MSTSGAGATVPGSTGIPNALKNAGFLSQLFFTWALPILRQGDDLRADQVFELLPQDSTTLLYSKLARAWDATLAAGKPSLVRAFWGAFGWNFLVTIPWLAVKCCFIVAQTQFLGLLLTTLGAGAQADGTAAYLYGLGFILCALFNAFLHHSFFFAAWRSGMRWRAAASALVFHKSLKLRLDALSRVSAGHVINLASNDVERLQKLSQYSPYLVVVPMETVVVFWLLWREVGVSTLAGVAVLAAMMVMMTIFSAKFGVLRAETASISDARIRLTGQIVAGIRTLKIQGWEAPFARQVAAVRAAEIGKIRFTSGLRGVNEGVFLVASILIAAATFLTYTGLGNTLTPRSLWVTMSLFAILQLEAAKFFPLGLEGLSEVRISLRRIQAFLLLPEAGSDGVTPLMDADSGSAAESAGASRKAAASRAVVADAGVTVTANPVVAVAALKLSATVADATADAEAGASIVVEHLTCSWGDGTRPAASGSNSAATAASKPAKYDSHDDDDSTSSAEARAALRDISFTAGAGQLTMVVGPVACGKTSLLMALIGELPAASGRVTLPCGARVAYVSQTPWIVTGTVRDNITFGLPFDAALYDRVVDGCCLRPDIAGFPAGDAEVIGERGVSLSGGQRARLSLARACYLQADVYLIDDALAAVDAKVGRRLFRRCIGGGLLAGKTRVLVLHQLQYLRAADSIVVMSHGRVITQGAFGELARVLAAERSRAAAAATASGTGGSSAVAAVVVDPSADPRAAALGAALSEILLSAHGAEGARDRSTSAASGADSRRESVASSLDLESLTAGDGGEDADDGGDDEAHTAAAAAAWAGVAGGAGGDADGILRSASSIRAASYPSATAALMVGRQYSGVSMTDGAAASPLAGAAAGAPHLAYIPRPESGTLPPGMTALGTPTILAPLPEPRAAPASPGAAGELLASASVPLTPAAGSTPPAADAPAGAKVLPAAAEASPAAAPAPASAAPAAGGGGGGGLIQAEAMASGGVGMRSYVQYWAAAGGLLHFIYLTVLLLGGATLFTYTSVWLARWSTLDAVSQTERVYPAVFGGLVAASLVVSLWRALAFFVACVSAAQKLHDAAFSHVLKAPVQFFDANPAGRILNRFSKDVGMLDDLLPLTWFDFLASLASVLATLGLVCAINPWVLLSLPPLALSFVLLQRFYVRSSRAVKRLEAVSRSPVFSLMNECLTGLPVIRAFRLRRLLSARYLEAADANGRAYFAFLGISRWLGIRLDLQCVGLMVATTFAAIALRSSISPALIGLSISQAATLAGGYQWCVRQVVELQNMFTSVERVQEYSGLPTEGVDVEDVAEAGAHGGAVRLPISDAAATPSAGAAAAAASSLSHASLPPDWPARGDIVFNDVWLRYRPELPPVLRGLSARIAPGMKVGIVGRTGAGKSTILMALLRLVEPERHPLPPALRESVAGSAAEDGGEEGYAAVADHAASSTASAAASAQPSPAPGACGVSIDGVDLASVPLTRLRRSVSVIPQDPVLYSGSVRFNCDPFGQHADADVVTALQRVQLWETHLAPHGGLEYPVKEGGANLSVGARQLVCLARAILRHSRVILLDECSANIDQDSDAAIQATIRTAFADATIITVAHRLATVIDSSAILLLDGGRAAEFDHPHALLQRGSGHFWELVQETGPTSAAQLAAVAAKAWAETHGGRPDAAGHA